MHRRIREKLQDREYWEADIKNQTVVIRKEIKYITNNYQYSR